MYQEQFAAIECDVERRLVQHGRKYPAVDRLAAYSVNKAALLHKVRSHGVEPLAALPTTAWRSICQRSGLYQLTVFGTHTTAVNMDALVKHIENVGNWLLDRIVISMILGWGAITSIVSLMALHGNTDFGRFEKTIMTGAFTLMALAFGFIITLVASRLIEGNIYRLAGRYWIMRHWREVLNLLFATPRRDLIDVRLPTPPAEVADIISRVKPLRPHTAAVAEAIRFPHLMTELDLRLPTLDADPIIYVEEGDVTVIVAQYGECPIERDVVRKLNHDEVL